MRMLSFSGKICTRDAVSTKDPTYVNVADSRNSRLYDIDKNLYLMWICQVWISASLMKI